MEGELVAKGLGWALNKGTEILNKNALKLITDEISGMRNQMTKEEYLNTALTKILEGLRYEFEPEKIKEGVVPDRVFAPDQSVEEMKENLMPYWNTYLEDAVDSDHKETILTYVCQVYLGKVEDEITPAHVLKGVRHSEKNVENLVTDSAEQITRKMNEETKQVSQVINDDTKQIIQKVDDTRQYFDQKLEGLQTMIIGNTGNRQNDGSSSKQAEQGKEEEVYYNTSTEIFRAKYNAQLFLGENIKLSQVYIPPRVAPKTFTGREEWCGSTIEKDTELLNSFKNQYDSLEWVQYFLENDQFHFMLLQGAPGIGKSSLMFQLAHDHEKDESFYAFFLSDISDNRNKPFSERFEEMLKEQEITFSEFRRKCRILVLDGYDEIAEVVDSDDFKSFVSKMMFDKQVHRKVIVTTRPGYLKVDSRTCGMTLIEYDDELISKWIRAYKTALHEDESNIDIAVKKFTKKMKEKQFKKVLGIPIFLYIVISQDMDIQEIKNISQLYEKVFFKLSEEKANYREIAEKAEKTAKCMSFFMQDNSDKRFKVQAHDQRFRKLYEWVMDGKLEDDYVKNVIRSSFIHEITEGEREIEFYHKSMQDYFSAKMIVFMLMRYREMTFADYMHLLEQHSFREELPHIIYLLKNEVKNKELILALQSLFFEISRKGFSAGLPDWQSSDTFNLDEPESGKAHPAHIFVNPEEYVRRLRCLTDNHVMLMTEVFNKPVLNKEQYKEFALSGYNFLNTYLFGNRKKNDEKSVGIHFWSFFQYLPLEPDTHFALLGNVYSGCLFPDRMKIVGTYFKKAVLDFYGTDTEYIDTLHSTCVDVKMKNMCLKKIEAKHFSGKNVRLEGSWIKSGIFKKSVFDSVSMQVKQLNKMTFLNCRFRNLTVGSDEIMVKMSDIIFTNCVFDNIQFKNVVYEGKIIFENCKDRNGKEFNLINETEKIKDSFPV